MSASAPTTSHQPESEEDLDEYAWTSPPHFSPANPLHLSLRTFDRTLRCLICQDLYNIPISLTTCGHTFCSECIRNCLRTGLKGMRRKTECPVCRKEVGEGGRYEKCLFPNRALEESVRRYRDMRGGLRSSLMRLAELEVATVAGGKGGGQSAKAEDGKVAVKKRGRGRPRKKRKAVDENLGEGVSGDGGGKRPMRRSARKAASSTVERPSPAAYEGPDTSSVEDNDFSDDNDCNDSDSTVDYRSPGEEKKCDADDAVTTAPVAAIPPVMPTESPPPPPRRQKKPSAHYHLLKRKKLMDLCASEGLSTRGTEKELKDRHAEYVTLYNAECDALYPRSVKELAEEMSRRERARKEEKIQSICNGSNMHSVHMQKLKESRKAAGEAPGASAGVMVSSGNVAFDAAMDLGFKKLVAEARARKKVGKPKQRDGDNKGGGVVKTTERLTTASAAAPTAVVPPATATSPPSAVTAVLSLRASSPPGAHEQARALRLQNEARAAAGLPPLASPAAAVPVAPCPTTISSPVATAALPPVAYDRDRAMRLQKEARAAAGLPPLANPPAVAAHVEAKPIPKGQATAAPSPSGGVSGGNESSRATYDEGDKSSSPSSSMIGPWQCRACTYFNKVRTWSMAKCEMCNGPRSCQAVLAGPGAERDAVAEVDC